MKLRHTLLCHAMPHPLRGGWLALGWHNMRGKKIGQQPRLFSHLPFFVSEFTPLYHRGEGGVWQVRGRGGGTYMHAYMHV